MGSKFSRLSRKGHPSKYERGTSVFEHNNDLPQHQFRLSAMREYPPCHNGGVYSIDSLFDADLTVSCGNDKTVTTFDCGQGKEVCKWYGHSTDVVRVCCASESDFIFSSSRDKTIRCWKLSNREDAIHSLNGHSLVAPALSFSAKSNKLFSGSRDNSVKLWDVATASCITTKDIPRNIVTDAKWFNDGTTIAQTGEDKILKIWDSRTMDVISNFPMKQYFQTCCAVSNDDRFIVTGSTGFNGKGSEVIVWDVRQGRTMVQFSGHTGRVTGCQFVKTKASVTDSEQIATVSSDSSLRIWSLSQQELLSNITVEGASDVTAITQLRNHRVALSTLERGICLYDLSHPSLPCLIASY